MVDEKSSCTEGVGCVCRGEERFGVEVRSCL
jgi:hypothetical protein